ncbi:MAG TPA: hypothetical protein VGF76_23505, partial [Polyangiaceae bacterium]
MAIFGLRSRPRISPRRLPRTAREAQKMHGTMCNSEPYAVSVPDASPERPWKIAGEGHSFVRCTIGGTLAQCDLFGIPSTSH